MLICLYRLFVRMSNKWYPCCRQSCAWSIVRLIASPESVKPISKFISTHRARWPSTSRCLISDYANNQPNYYGTLADPPPAQFLPPTGHNHLTALPYPSVLLPISGTFLNSGLEAHFQSFPPLLGLPWTCPPFPSILHDQKGPSQQQPQVENSGPEHTNEGSLEHVVRSLLPLSSQRPFYIRPEIFILNPLLLALTEQLFQETWYINAAEERLISEEEARLRLGPAGKSIFLAYTRSFPGNASRTHWSCLICEAANGAANQIVPGYGREDRILRHIRHHFRHRPWICSGQCGRAQW